MTARLALALIAIVVCAWSSAAAAQSLGDLARKEAERRGTRVPPERTYTNENLTPDFTTPPPAPTPEVAAPAPKADETPATEDAKTKDAEDAVKWGITPQSEQEPGPSDELNEQFWRERAAFLRNRLVSQNAQIEQLRRSVASMPRDGAAGEREIVERTLAKAVRDLEFFNADWLRFEKQARDRKVPEHWIR